MEQALRKNVAVDTEQSLRKIVAKIAETSQNFAPGASLREELNVDSVRLIELWFEIERTFNVQVPEEHYGKVRTFEDLLAFVKSMEH